MPDITVVAVGKLKEKAMRCLCEDYAGRIRRTSRLSIVELRDSNPLREGEKMCQYLERCKGLKIALSEEGESYGSVAFSQWFAPTQKDIVFFIGGPFGLSEAIKQAADRLISLSPMTFTHEFARVLLLEQVYRSQQILAGSGYHHG